MGGVEEGVNWEAYHLTDMHRGWQSEWWPRRIPILPTHTDGDGGRNAMAEAGFNLALLYQDAVLTEVSATMAGEPWLAGEPWRVSIALGRGVNGSGWLIRRVFFLAFLPRLASPASGDVGSVGARVSGEGALAGFPLSCPAPHSPTVTLA